MASKTVKYLVVGLPDAGKTTFLAALWHVVESDEVRDSLRLQELYGDRQHLNRIRDRWLKCQKVDRTKIGSEPVVSMKLAESVGGRGVELVFQDTSGESFRQQWEERKWSKEYDELARDASGALLFLHPDKVFGVARITEAEGVLHQLGVKATSASTEADTPTEPWHPKTAPTQVQLVDLLQFLEVKAYVIKPFKVAVVVSAWDLAIGEDLSPEEWLTRRVPLLHQYLLANRDIFPSRIYGVSAQGGDVDSDAGQLLEKHPSSERIVVVGKDAEPHDITAPVKWLMAEE